MQYFRHYIVGVTITGDEDVEDFITTTLSLCDAEKFVRSHAQQFRNRYKHYEIQDIDGVALSTFSPESVDERKIGV